MRLFFVLLLLFTVRLTLLAQVASVIPTSASVANTSVADHQRWHAFSNPAMIAQLKTPQLGLLYENHSLLHELSTRSAQALVTSRFANAAVSFSYFGYPLYHEIMTGIGLARDFSGRFSLGVQFSGMWTYFAATDSYRFAMFPQIGLCTRLSEQFTLGFHAFNPFQTNIQTSVIIKRIPSVFSLGFAYHFNDDLVWRFQGDKEISSNYRFAGGFEYTMMEQMVVKLGGYATDYFIPCIGVGWEVGSLVLDLNTDVHPMLGLNSFASVKYNFK